VSRDHRKLDAFQLADNLVLMVYRETVTFPSAERYGLVSQMRRSAVSAAANIVEGCARPTKKDYIRFLGLAFASVRELGYLISLADRLEFLQQESATELTNLQGRVAAALSALIKSLK
jgi:four helix bundle protein